MTTPRFSADTVVVHPSFGIGTILSTKAVKITGLDTMVYDILYLDGSIQQTPVVNKNLRAVASKDEATKALAALTKKRQQPDAHWYRVKKEYEQRIARGLIEDLATVARDLYREDEAMSTQARELFEKALDHMAAEVAYVLKLPRQGVRSAIEDTIRHRRLATLFQEKP